MPSWLSYPLSLGSLAAAVLLYRRGDPVTAVAVVVIALSGWIGFRMGFGRIVATVVAFVTAVAYAPSIGMKYENSFSDQFGTTGLTNRFLCIASIGVLISLLVTIVITILSNRFLAKRRKLNVLNSAGGFAVGLTEGVAIVFLGLGGLLSLQMWQRADNLKKNAVAVAVDEWASTTRQSAIGPIIRDYNPFERLRFLARAEEVHHTIRRLGDARNIQQLLDDPKIAALRTDPAISAAIDEIRNDREFIDLIKQKGSLDKQTLLHLMNNPGLMRLLENPAFIETARQAISEME